MFLVIAFGSHGIYSLLYVMGGSSTQEITIGLSGVVFGIMLFVAIVVPRIKVRYGSWMIVYLSTIGLSVWIFVFFFVSLDLINLLFDSDQNNTNYVVHLAGVVVGASVALLIPRKIRRRLALKSVIHGLKGTYPALEYQGYSVKKNSEK